MKRRVDTRLLRGAIAAGVMCIMLFDANPIQALQAPQALSCTSPGGETSTTIIDASASTADGDPALFTDRQIVSIGLLQNDVFVRSIDRYSLIRTFWMARYRPGEKEQMEREIVAASTPDANRAFVRANYAAIIARSAQDYSESYGDLREQCTLVQRAL